MAPFVALKADIEKQRLKKERKMQRMDKIDDLEAKEMKIIEKSK